MDTPDRNLICTPISKFEDSPVFNYLNSLSPIKPVKSVNIQTFNSLSFSSPPSVFTSPHASNQKESRFLKRHYFSDSTKSGLSSENGNEGNTSVTVVDTDQVFNCSGGPPERFESGNVVREVTVDPPNQSLEVPVELPRTLKFDCGSPDGNSTPCDGFETDKVQKISEASKALVPFVQEVKVERRASLEGATGLEGICHLEQDKEDGTGSDWENMISAPADLLVFDPSNDAEASKEQAPQNNPDVLPTTETAAQVGFCTLNEMENPATQSEEGVEQMEIDHTPHELPSTFQTPSEKMDDEAGNCIPFGKQQRGTRRRCLVFEMVGAHKRNLEDDSKSSSVLSESNGKFASEDKQMVPFKAGTSSSPCMLPGIGLHLNALAATTKDPRVVKHETLPSGRQLISLPGRISPFHSVVSEQKPLNKTLDLNSLERDTGPADSEVQFIQDACRSSAFGVREEFNESSSPKKKRRRLEPDVESESCKRCNCKKSKCLKLYCECFAAGVYCVEPCSCQDCFNKPIHEDTVLATRKQIESRNPLAFAPKVIRAKESAPEIGDESNKTPASARHKRGCNCKKSSCLKKYCECYQGGVGCSINCRCEGCKNAFGRKDGTMPTGAEEAEQDEEAETCEKSNVHKGLHISELQKDNDEQYQDHVMPITPFQICRMSVQLEFSSIGKPPRPSMFPVGSSPRPHSNRAPKRSEILPTPLKLEDHFQVLPDDETPEILRSDCSPIRAVKTSSPNRKRVSPPHREHALSPGRRNSRKLILQSIPAFPTLAYHEAGDQQ